MILAGLALTAGVFYGVYVHELAGSVLLGVFSVALLYIATVLRGASEYDTAELDQDAEPQVGPEHVFPPSWWPLVMALGAGVALIGLKYQVVVMAVGFAIFLVAAVGWFVQAGHQSAHSADAHAEPGSTGH